MPFLTAKQPPNNQKIMRLSLTYLHRLIAMLRQEQLFTLIMTRALPVLTTKQRQNNQKIMRLSHFRVCLAMTPLSQDLAANFSLKPAKLLLGMRWRNKYAWTQLKLVVAHALLTCIRLASRVCKSRGSKTAVSLTMQKPSSCLENQAPPRLRPFAGTLMRKIVSSDG